MNIRRFPIPVVDYTARDQRSSVRPRWIWCTSRFFFFFVFFIFWSDSMFCINWFSWKNGFLRYDSGTKIFNQIPTKHLGATIDGYIFSLLLNLKSDGFGNKIDNLAHGTSLFSLFFSFTIKDEFWQKARIPHSTAPSHRDNWTVPDDQDYCSSASSPHWLL